MHNLLLKQKPAPLPRLNRSLGKKIGTPVIKGRDFIKDRFFTPYLLNKQKFQPKIRIFIERNKYLVKTAETDSEFRDVLKLRFNVFYKEYIKKSGVDGFDIDKFDFICDHLMVIDREKERCIGTYRLISSVFSESFYSETEFDMERIRKLPGNILELGRSCTDKEARNGIILALLWKGLSEYIKESGSKYAFGCTSVKTADLHKAAVMYLFLKNRYMAEEAFRVVPKNRYFIKNLDSHIKFLERKGYSVDEKRVKKMLSPLLLSYLNIGAKVCGQPAYDRHFKCIDFFTLLKMKDSSMSFKRRFELP